MRCRLRPMGATRYGAGRRAESGRAPWGCPACRRPFKSVILFLRAPIARDARIEPERLQTS